MKLENWILINDKGEHILIGDVYNDVRKKFTDGENIRTSAIKMISFDNKTAITQNSVYDLGEQSKGTRMWPSKKDQDAQPPVTRFNYDTVDR